MAGASAWRGHDRGDEGLSAPGLLLDLTGLQGRSHSERGTARYVARHARALLQIPGVVRRLFLNPSAPPPVGLDPAFDTPMLRWHTTDEMDEALREGPCAFHIMAPYDFCDNALSHVLPARLPGIATVFDLIPILQTEQYPLHTRTIFLNRVARMARADFLLAISDSARRDAIELLGVDPARIATIGAGVDDRFRPPPADAPPPREPFEALGLDGPYIMAVLSSERRKNLHGLMDAMALLPGDVARSIKLLVVGTFGDEGMRDYLAMPAAKILGDRLIFSGRISDEWLITFYQHATLNVYPSLYEGFGLPAAEAAACGCPTITSNTSSLPEVLGMPEATFDPESPAEMASLIARAHRFRVPRRDHQARDRRLARAHVGTRRRAHRRGAGGRRGFSEPPRAPARAAPAAHRARRPPAACGQRHCGLQRTHLRGTPAALPPRCLHDRARFRALAVVVSRALPLRVEPGRAHQPRRLRCGHLHDGQQPAPP